MKNTLFIIIACALVNYLLRVIPFIRQTSGEIRPFMKRFLEFMPIAALGALILPGIITSFPQNPAAGISGVAAAAAVSWIAGGLMMPVIASIGITWILLHFF